MSPMSAGVLPMLLDMSKDECLGELRSLVRHAITSKSTTDGRASQRTLQSNLDSDAESTYLPSELLAYRHLVSVFRAQGDLSKEKRKLLAEIQNILAIPLERHKAEIRRANNDELLYTVAETICGRSTQVEWAVEARRLVPLLPRAIPQIAYTAYATKMAQEYYKINMTKPQPQDTAQLLPDQDLGQLSSDTDSDNETEGLRYFSDDMMPEQLCRRSRYSTALVHAQQSSEPPPRVNLTPPPDTAPSPPPPPSEKRKRKRSSSLERLVPQAVPLFLSQSPVTPPHPGAPMEYEDAFADLDMPSAKQVRRNSGSGGGMKISMTGGPGLRQPPSSSTALPAQKVILVSTSGASGGTAPVAAGGATGGVNVYQRPISVLKSGTAPSAGGVSSGPTSGPPAQPGAGAAPSTRPGPGGPAPVSGVRPAAAGGPSPAVRPSVQQSGGPTARPMSSAGGPLVTSVRPVAGSIRPLNSASVASAPGGGMGALSGAGRQTPGPQQSYMGQPHVTSIIHSGGGPVTASSPPGGGVMARVRPRLATPIGLPPRGPPPHRVTRPQQPQIVLQQQADGSAGLESGGSYTFSGAQQQQHGPTQHATLQVRSSGGVLSRSTSLSGVSRTTDLAGGSVINRVVSVGGSPLVAGCSRLITRPALGHSNNPAPTQQQQQASQNAPSSSTASCQQQPSSQLVQSYHGQYGGAPQQTTVYQSGPPPHQGTYQGPPAGGGPQQPPQSQSPPVFPGSTSSSTITVVTRTVAPQHQLALQGGSGGGVSQRVVTLNTNRPGGLSAGGGGSASAQRPQQATPGGRNPITTTIGIANSTSTTGTRATFGAGPVSRIGSGSNTGGGGGLITSSISFSNSPSPAGGGGGGTGSNIRGGGLSITTSGGGRGGSSLRATTGSMPPRSGGIGLGVAGRGGGALSSRGGGGALSSRGGGVRSSVQTVRVPPGSVRSVSAGTGKSNVIVVHKGAPTPSPRTHATYSTSPRDISTKITIGKSVGGGGLGSSTTPRLGSGAGMARSAPSLLRTTLQAPHTAKTALQSDCQQGKSCAPSRYTPPLAQQKQLDRAADQQSRTGHHHHQQQQHHLSRQEHSNIVLAGCDDSNGASEFGRAETDMHESVSLAPGSTGSSGCRSKSSSRSQSPANYSSSPPPPASQVGHHNTATSTTYSSHSAPMEQQHFTTSSSSIGGYHSSLSSSSTPGTSYTIISPSSVSNTIVEEEITTISAASAQAMYAAANSAASTSGSVFTSVGDQSSSQVVGGTTYVAYPTSGSGVVAAGGSNPPQLELGEDWLTLSSTSGADGLTNDSTTTSATLPNGQMQVLEEAMEVLTRGDKESARSLLLQAGIELLDSPATASGGEGSGATAPGDALLTEEDLADEEGTVLLSAHHHLDDSPSEVGPQALESGSEEAGCSSPGGGNSRVQVGPSRTSVPPHLHTGLFLAATANTGPLSPKDECDEDLDDE